ncbi:MAG: hypothetical protein IPQ08_05730 [Chitinophagaceae bacterium]|nr:hypothetical protein [Chitinophagaceae bacterium]
MDKLPTFELIINPDETSDVEVSFVALVDKPAIEKNFLAFNSKELHFAVDPEKRIISGPAMIADSLIYRRDDQGEYNVFFSADTIKQIALKFFKKDYQKNLNLFHDPSLSLDGVTIFESFISDKSRGILPMSAFKDLPDGTWFISAKIENDAVWDKVKSGEVKGFSVEGIFSYVKKLSRTDGHEAHLSANDSLMDNILDTLKEIKEKFLGTTPVAPVVPQVLSTDYTLADGTPVSIDKLEVGGVVLVNGVAAPAGEHQLSDGTKIMVGDGGVISAVETPSSEAPAAPDFSAQFTEINEKFAGYEQKFEAYEARFAQAEEALSKANGVIVSLMSIVEQLAKSPTADPVGENKGNFTTQKVQLASEKRKQLSESIQALKNKK